MLANTIGYGKVEVVMFELEWLLLYGLLGSCVGFIAGLLGVGGGGILVPLLASIFIWQGINQQYVVHSALATALACMMITSLASIRAHAKHGAIQWHIAGGMGLGIIVGAMLGSQLAAKVDGVYLACFFSVFLALVALQLFFGWQPRRSKKPVSRGGLLTAGITIGSISVLAAVGGGFLSVTYMNYKNIELKQAIATSAAIGLPIAIAGTLGYMLSGEISSDFSSPYTVGYIHISAFLMVSFFSVLTAPQGARLAHYLPASVLKKIFAIISLLLSIKMLISVM